MTDGFTGNVALKLLEGTSKVLLGQVKDAMTVDAVNKAAAAVLKPRSDQAARSGSTRTRYGGAPLLGVDGVCIIGHGSSKAKAVCNGIRVAAQAGRGGLTEQIAESDRRTTRTSHAACGVCEPAAYA